MTARSFRAPVLVLPVLLAACGGERESAPAPAAAPAERVATVRTVAVEPRPVRDAVSLPADLRPHRRAVLAAEVPGAVESVRVDEGDRVARGQALLSVDRRALEQGLAEAEAVNLQRAKQHERAENLFAKQSITQAQLLDAITNRDVAAAALASARLQLAKATVQAPWAGTVADRRVEVGDYVQPGQPVIELVELDRLDVVAPVAAEDAPHLKVGEPVTVTVDAFPGERFLATVTRIAPEVDPSSRTLDVEAELANPGERLRPGMPARLELVRRAWERAITVPRAALVELEGSRVVYVVEDGVARQRAVTTGPLVGDEVLVTDGLAAGDRVVVEGQRQVSPGQTVTEGGGEGS